jgi:hypothetical protein
VIEWCTVQEGEASASVNEACSVRAHGEGAACVRWGARGLLASAGGDRWARVWRHDDKRLLPLAAVPAPGAGGAPAVRTSLFLFQKSLVFCEVDEAVDG